MSHRTFIAIDIDEGLRAALTEVGEALSYEGDKVKWVDPGQFHITLAFLGDVEDRVLNDLCGMIASAASHIEPFEFNVSRISCQPGHGTLHMIWADIDDPSGQMAELHEQTNLAVGELGLRQEARKYRPHITLARIKHVRDPDRLRSAARAYGLDAFPFQHADEVVVYASQLTPEGPIYTPLARLEIGR